MENLSEFKSRKEWEAAIWGKFLENIRQSKSKRELKEFFNGLLSAGEKKAIIKRLIAISLIKQGKTYRDIREIVWISHNTISALKKMLKKRSEYQNNPSLNKKNKMNKRGRTRGVPEKTIFDYWLNFPLPSYTGKGRWKFLNYQG
jgi:uncharacterized protein YerC